MPFFGTSDCDIYIVCNPDILVGDNFYRGTVEFLRRCPEAGLMSARMTYKNGRMQTAGWRTFYNPEVSVVHGWERAAHTSLYMGGVLLRNGACYFRKWGWRLW